MSKRRNRKQINKPNLPEETLARARREAGVEAEEIEEAEEEMVEAVVAKPAPRPTPREAAPHSAEMLPSAQRRSRRKERAADPSQMTQAEVADRLAHPTKTVSEEQLRTQYSYVIADLSSMGVLAAALGIIMIVIARFL
ncbi:MAG: hypothetical protein K8J31_11450 [Anaerolineae bacterium]|nr:hypothetical protein [Anaerolineae bacterium]